jgi:hypothetical protein
VPPSIPLQPVADPGDGFALDASLPAFDDAVPVVDPVAEAKSRIETSVARGRFTSAVRSLAATRKTQRDFVLSPESMGKLAEGLVHEQHIKPALTVLAIAAESYPVFAPRWRIRAATIELTVNRDAIAAIKQLKLVDKQMLDVKTREQFLKVAQRAQQMAQS